MSSEVIDSKTIEGLVWETHQYTMNTMTIAINNSNFTCVSLFGDDVVGWSENMIYVTEAGSQRSSISKFLKIYV